MCYNKTMEYIDLRKISTEEAKQIRRQVVRLKKMGKKGKEIEEIVGVRQNRISENMVSVSKRGRSIIREEENRKERGLRDDPVSG